MLDQISQVKIVKSLIMVGPQFMASFPLCYLCIMIIYMIYEHIVSLMKTCLRTKHYHGREWLSYLHVTYEYMEYTFMYCMINRIKKDFFLLCTA